MIQSSAAGTFRRVDCIALCGGIEPDGVQRDGIGLGHRSVKVICCPWVVLLAYRAVSWMGSVQFGVRAGGCTSFSGEGRQFGVLDYDAR